MEWLDSFELHSDESINPFHFSPPRLDLEPKTNENTKQAENVPIDLVNVESTPMLDDRMIIEQKERPGINGSQLVESTDPTSEWINRHVEWTREENKAFENALAVVDHLSPTFFEDVASMVPTKSALDIKAHYEKLVWDVEMIESGLIEPPEYLDDEYDEDSSSTDLERDGCEPRRRGPGWTEEEHKLFLRGLAKYGKGDWKSISRHCLVNRTPSQIASHAQKFYQRMQTNDCTSDFPLRPRRRSIHDIRNLPPTTTTTTTTTVPSPLLESTLGQTSTDQQTVPAAPSSPLSYMNNASNSTRKRSRGVLDNGSSSSRPTITSSTTTSYPPPRGRPRGNSHQQTKNALPPARNSLTLDNIVKVINNQKAGSHGLLGYQNSSFPSLGTSSGTTTSFQSLKPKNHQETEQALRPHKSITMDNMVNADNNHKQSHDFC